MSNYSPRKPTYHQDNEGILPTHALNAEIRRIIAQDEISDFSPANLKAIGLKATLHLITAYIHRQFPYLTEKKCRELAERTMNCPETTMILEEHIYHALSRNPALRDKLNTLEKLGKSQAEIASIPSSVDDRHSSDLPQPAAILENKEKNLIAESLTYTFSPQSLEEIKQWILNTQEKLMKKLNIISPILSEEMINEYAEKLHELDKNYFTLEKKCHEEFFNKIRADKNNTPSKEEFDHALKTLSTQKKQLLLQHNEEVMSFQNEFIQKSAGNQFRS